ncbi:hypothetical protein [Klebsiella pneumoniae]|uniref:hypothetical protein n=1 Tax=Klebsiella pneumoniae TaxID=573 RepID=UPI0015FEC669|nr:hypothetical protein [Klebsiella pneumoniae]
MIKELQTNIHEVARLTATEYIPNKELPQKKPSNSSETLVYIATEIDDITKLEPDAIKNLMYLNLFFLFDALIPRFFLKRYMRKKQGNIPVKMIGIDKKTGSSLNTAIPHRKNKLTIRTNTWTKTCWWMKVWNKNKLNIHIMR